MDTGRGSSNDMWGINGDLRQDDPQTTRLSL